jgi:hypothetical protein
MTNNVINKKLFLRNSFEKSGFYSFPLIKKDYIDVENINLISYSDTSMRDVKNLECGVHFFIDDYRFEGIYNHPEKSLEKLKKYKFLCTPDFSLYSEMDRWRKIENVAKNRWVGAYWQEHGLKVITTISWGSPATYDYCFDGVEEGSIVAISTLGCKKAKRQFLSGYKEMKKRIKPSAIICFDTPFDEFKDEVIVVNYLESRKVMR